ncbi:MAG: MBL fold metallo-hydrolase [Saprospiraceae bacterium]|nr:MBL fold metallo-hydrolase [Saprospiraceae bacterium]
MKVEQIYTGCLAQGAYYIESEGEVAIIDPLREVQPYLDRAESNGAKIKYILETHFHADFVSGHLTLAEKTGAPIIFGPTANPSFEATIAEDGQILKLGNVSIKILHTPGHTMESTTFLLIDETGKDHAIFSGDTLFLGDVGRPDLAQKAASMTQEKLAATLYNSLRTKIMTLADDVVVYPGHGAGSACGKNMSKETVGTIGQQKMTNYALRADMTQEEFIKEVTDGLLAPPAYFPMNVKMNKEGYKSIDDVLERGMHALDTDAFEKAANSTGAVILDVRHQREFVKGFVPRSTFIGLNGGFAPWVGGLIKDVKQPILLVVEQERLKEAVTRLARVGFDNIIGYLDGGIEGWTKEKDTMPSIPAEEFAKVQNPFVLDVRKKGEYLSEHMVGAINTPLSSLNDYLDQFSEEETMYIHCAGGYRSVIAGSILKARGIHNIVNVEGGFKVMKKTTIPVSAYVCPSTL